MPTVFRLNGLRVVIYPNDHRPPHVHVIGNGHEAVFALNCPNGPLELRENYGFSQKELSGIAEALTNALSASCQQGEHIHGDRPSL